MIVSLIRNEFSKQKRNLFILFVLAIPLAIGGLLCIDLLIRYESWLLPQAIEKGLTSWQVLIQEQRILYFNDFMPLFSALILGSLFEEEYKNNSWTFLLTKPVKRNHILFSKYAVASIYTLLMLIINILSLIIVGMIFKFKEPIPWKFFGIMLSIQMIASLVIMAIHLYFNLKNKNVFFSIGIAGVLSSISSSLYHEEGFIKNINPYGFSLFSITQVNEEMRLLIIVSLILLIIVPLFLMNYFKKKEIY